MRESTERDYLEGLRLEDKREHYDSENGYKELRHVVAGMLSTTEFTPAQVYPGNMLPLADRVIRYVQQFGNWEAQGDAERFPAVDF